MTLAAPAGFRFSALASGIKPAGKPDMALICSDTSATCAGVYTRNRVVAAPVQICRENLKQGLCRAILVNSGNANACTGSEGYQTAQKTLELCATTLDIDRSQIALASTGVIGVQLPFAPFEKGLITLADNLATDQADAVAEAIMTTDAFRKTAMVEDELGYRMLALAKGAGMIHPNMGTMLAFVLCDARVEQGFLQRTLQQAVDRSFNSITVDGDTSTNDTVLTLCNGAAGKDLIEEGSEAAQRFSEHLHDVLLTLAKMIVRDGEGASKLVRIHVTGAGDEQEARRAAHSVATSSLVKTAFFGEDANWGRIIAAVGYSGIEVDQHKIDISFADIAVVKNGLSTGPELEDQATQVLKRDEFEVIVNLNQGAASADYYTSDLGYEYVRINADYRS